MKSILAAVLLGASLWTQSANAQIDLCRAVIQPGVVSGEHEVLRAGDTYRMQLTLGAGTITGSPIPGSFDRHSRRTVCPGLSLHRHADSGSLYRGGQRGRLS